MLYGVYVALGVVLALLTIHFASIHPLFFFLLSPLYGFLLCILSLLFFLGTALLFKKNKVPERIRPSYYRFQLFYNSHIMLKLLRVRIHVIGKEKLPRDKKQPLMFVSNHLSHFDPFVGSTVFYSRRVVYVTKPENAAIPLYGKYIIRAGFIPIDRANPREAMRAIQLAARRMKEDGCAVGIYPEGTISRSKSLLGFHDGVFLAAKKAKAPVVVTVLLHTDKIKHNWYRFGTDVCLQIIDVIPAEEVVEMRTTDLSHRVREMMRKTLIEAGYDAPPTEEAEVADLSQLQKAPPTDAENA